MTAATGTGGLTFGRLGLQRRIMLYVAVGLALMFASFTALGLRSLQQATQLVYRERQAIAQFTAVAMGRDFLHVAREVEEARRGLEGDTWRTVAERLLAHLARTDPFLFFRVSGLWILDSRGRLVAAAGSPEPEAAGYGSLVASVSMREPGSRFTALPAIGGPEGEVPFAAILVPVGADPASPGLLAVVHTVSINSPGSYVPTAFWPEGPDRPIATRVRDAHAEYHLEVVSPEGRAILGIGEDERPGQMSPHAAVLGRIMAARQATTLLHEPQAGDAFERHVMAVVPVPSSPFYIVLEQPADVALAMPLRLRQHLLLLTAAGFMAALIVAWITTRHVVQPTEELTRAAQRMAEGDLESPIGIRAQDEVGGLAESLDIMRQRLRAAQEEIAGSNRVLEQQVRERTARLGEALRQSLSAQEEERYRLARELHDETAQALGALGIALDRARDALTGASPEALERLREAKAVTSRLLEEIRRLILDLRPLVLDDLGLGPAIRWYVETHLEERGVEVVLEMDTPAPRLPKPIEVALFRVVQEAVNNIVRHAQARHARIRLAYADGVARAVVRDDGQGFDVERVLGPHASFATVGLLGMQERVRLLDGRIQVRSQSGQGTEVTVEIPLVSEAA